jgi:hypothetical protein
LEDRESAAATDDDDDDDDDDDGPFLPAEERITAEVEGKYK